MFYFFRLFAVLLFWCFFVFAFSQQRDLDCFRLLHNWSARQKLPLEVVFDSGGSRHAETWRCRLQVGGRSWVSGEERSKKVARKAAALLAWTAVEAEALV